MPEAERVWKELDVVCASLTSKGTCTPKARLLQLASPARNIHVCAHSSNYLYPQHALKVTACPFQGDHHNPSQSIFREGRDHRPRPASRGDKSLKTKHSFLNTRFLFLDWILVLFCQDWKQTKQTRNT